MAPACAWNGNIKKPAVSAPVKGCGPVKPDGQDRVDDNAYSACSETGTSYACLDTSAFTENGQRYAFAAIELDITSSDNPVSCCECYEASYDSGPLAGETIQVQMINNGVGAGSGILDLHVVGAGHGYNNVVAKDSNNDPYGGSMGQTGVDNPPMFSESDWGDQDGLWGRRFAQNGGYAGGISSACSDIEECFAMCEALPAPAVDRCKWEFADEGMRKASVPSATIRRIKCPSALHSRSGCLLQEDQDFQSSDETPAPIEDQEEEQQGDAGAEGDLQNERGRHVRFFSSQCQDKIWEQNSVTGEPEVYTCADYASWGFCDEDWMEGWCDRTCDKSCQDHMWETNYNTQQPEVYTCADYASWGFCGEDWMDGWCEATCGRCSQPAEVGSDGDASSGDGNGDDGDMAGDEDDSDDDAGSGDGIGDGDMADDDTNNSSSGDVSDIDDGDAGSSDVAEEDGDMASDEDDMADDDTDDSSGGDDADDSIDKPGTVEERLTALEEEVEAIRAQVEDLSSQLL